MAASAMGFAPIAGNVIVSIVRIQQYSRNMNTSDDWYIEDTLKKPGQLQSDVGAGYLSRFMRRYPLVLPRDPFPSGWVGIDPRSRM